MWQTYESLPSPGPRRNHTWRAAAMLNSLIYIKAPLDEVDMLLIPHRAYCDRMACKESQNVTKLVFDMSGFVWKFDISKRRRQGWLQKHESNETLDCCQLMNLWFEIVEHYSTSGGIVTKESAIKTRLSSSWRRDLTDQWTVRFTSFLWTKCTGFNVVLFNIYVKLTVSI